ncbi:hypothetical protein TNCV_2196531 [Trichonephila clavipes]|nr:hypothetical protein TNCV_2196531 [Trichonephila clavipes]
MFLSHHEYFPQKSSLCIPIIPRLLETPKKRSIHGTVTASQTEKKGRKLTRAARSTGGENRWRLKEERVPRVDLPPHCPRKRKRWEA